MTQRDRTLIAIAAFSGLRRFEILALDWRQVYAPDGAVREVIELKKAHTKKKHGGVVRVGPRLEAELVTYRIGALASGVVTAAQEAAPRHIALPIFYGTRGPLTAGTALRIWTAAQERAGLSRHYSFHALRHYFGTVFYHGTNDIRLTQLAMRHKSLSSTGIYLDAGEEEAAKAVKELF